MQHHVADMAVGKGLQRRVLSGTGADAAQHGARHTRNESWHSAALRFALSLNRIAACKRGLPHTYTLRAGGPICTRAYVCMPAWRQMQH